MKTEQKKNSSRMLLLDLFRVFAASYVMLYHYCFSSLNPNDRTALVFPEFSGFFQYGFMGVDFFFVISGFVICMSAEKGGIEKFVTSRLLRLYPAYITCVVLSSFVAVLFSVKQVSLLQFLVNLTMFQEFLGVSHVDGVYWTLSFELVFYFWVGLAILFGAIRKIELLLVPFLLVSFWAALVSEPKYVKALFISPWAHYFAAGVFFYKARQCGFTSLRIFALLLCLVISLLNANEMALRMSVYHGVGFSFFPMALHVLVIYFVMCLAALGSFDGVKQAWFRVAGSLTFPLYLLHGLIGNVILSFFSDESKFVGLVVTILLIYLLSYFVCQKIEPIVISKCRRHIELGVNFVFNWVSRLSMMRSGNMK